MLIMKRILLSNLIKKSIKAKRTESYAIDNSENIFDERNILMSFDKFQKASMEFLHFMLGT